MRFSPTSPLLLGLFFTIAILCRRGAADETPTTGAVRVALYAGGGAAKKGSPHLWRCLPERMDFRVTTVTAEDIRSGALRDFEVLIHPGGSGSKQAASLGEEGRRRVRQFVDQGGGFVGICAGAYLASASYPWSLNLLDARVVDSQHWDRGHGDVTLRLPPAGRSAFAEDDVLITAYYHQGPLLAPAENDDIPDYELLASFESEIAENGAPEGVMLGTTAIARGTFGKGRVICLSPHLEKTDGRDEFIRRAVRWAAQPTSVDSPAAAQ